MLRCNCRRFPCRHRTARGERYEINREIANLGVISSIDDYGVGFHSRANCQLQKFLLRS